MKGLRFPTGFTVLHLVKAKRPKHAGASSSGKLPEIQLIQDVELAISFDVAPVSIRLESRAGVGGKSSGSGRGQRRRTSRPSAAPPPAPEPLRRTARPSQRGRGPLREGRGRESTRRRGLEDEDVPSRRGRVRVPKDKRTSREGPSRGSRGTRPSSLRRSASCPEEGHGDTRRSRWSQTSPPEAGLLMRQSTFRNSNDVLRSLPWGPGGGGGRGDVPRAEEDRDGATQFSPPRRPVETGGAADEG
ncbi:hypothetical protein THAOC_10457 [Thalassiosira oceanica]|uniref:Uncharacterized protein n=1 Tax=Thalassiosira oceanica TaxID=159749 RepID=K0SSI1_THAOC|nr:hypothetical protein THAOC_10457 [Thalassiosira oceanica]|eukprot:EJK68365.1 hypothetical protein THAOC_10457 [Thalassiosira oceanica]